MSITPMSPAINQQGWVQTWVTSQWKNRPIPGQFSAEINSTQTENGGSTQKVDITVEQKTEITQVIKQESVEPIAVDFDVAVGVAVPQTIKVRLQPLPPRIVKIVPAYRGYLFFVLADGRVVIVEPSTLKIVVIIV